MIFVNSSKSFKLISKIKTFFVLYFVFLRFFQKNHNSVPFKVFEVDSTAKDAPFYLSTYIQKQKQYKICIHFFNLEIFEEFSKITKTFFSMYLFFLKSPNHYLQLCLRHQVERTNHSRADQFSTILDILHYSFINITHASLLRRASRKMFKTNAFF